MNTNIPGHSVVITDTGVTIDGHPVMVVDDATHIYPTCDPTVTTITVTILAREWRTECSPDTMARWVRIYESDVPMILPTMPPQRPALPPPPVTNPQVKPTTTTPRTPPTPPLRYTTHPDTP